MTGPPRSPPTSTTPLVAEVVVHEGVEVAAVRGHVVEAVGADVAVAEAAQVGDDHLEAGGGERLDHPPVDALGLGPAVDAAAAARPPMPSRTYACWNPRGGRGVDREAARVDVRPVCSLRRLTRVKPYALRCTRRVGRYEARSRRNT